MKIQYLEIVASDVTLCVRPMRVHTASQSISTEGLVPADSQP